MIFPQMMDVAQNSKAYPNADAILRATILAAIWTATETGALTTSSLDCSSVTEVQLIKIIADLREQGYNVTEGASAHITVTWQY
jgi:hypothetical protein